LSSPRSAHRRRPRYCIRRPPEVRVGIELTSRLAILTRWYAARKLKETIFYLENVIVQPVSSARSEIGTLYVGKLSTRILKTSYSWRCDVDDHSADANELLGRVPEAFREVQGTT
jgi:hypothetical protein